MYRSGVFYTRMAYIGMVHELSGKGDVWSYVNLLIVAIVISFFTIPLGMVLWPRGAKPFR